MKTLILDNFDSFTYNLYQYCAELSANPVVVRNNAITLDDIEREQYTHIIISPGPGSPDNEKDFGICEAVIQRYKGRLPILGVCLGHQGIIHALGGNIIRAPKPMHGKRSMMRIKGRGGIFRNLPEQIEAMRYHSLIGERETLPGELMVTAETDDQIIMAVQHREFPLYGVQFHPESIGTPLGKTILKNFLAMGNTHDRSHRPLKASLSNDAAEAFIEGIAAGSIAEKDVEQTLVEMAGRGESVSEIVGMARALRRHAVKLPLLSEVKSTKKFFIAGLRTAEPRGRSEVGSCGSQPNETELIFMDTCGTGGSGLPRFNISTVAAFVLAAAGVPIAKHGNRAVSGRSGSFDLLAELDVKIELSPEAVSQGVQELGIGFLFAPLFHPVMKKVSEVRKKIGARTIFNLLGPLVNPALPKYHLLGTTDEKTAEKLAHAMQELEYKRATVVAGGDGLDEVTLTGKTTVFALREGKIQSSEFEPEQLGMKREKSFDAIAGGTPKENADMALELLQGRGRPALQNLLLLNVAFALETRGRVTSREEGLELAKRTITNGEAYHKFLIYKNFSHHAALS